VVGSVSIGTSPLVPGGGQHLVTAGDQPLAGEVQAGDLG
jgi:hypothetical protein